MPHVKLNIDWTDLDAVKRLAISLRCKTPMLVIWNGRNYQITHECNIQSVIIRGDKIVTRIPGRE